MSTEKSDLNSMMEMLENYIKEYLKLQYEARNDSELYNKIRDSFTSEEYFPFKMHQFPELLAKALNNAETDLRATLGNEFDNTKLKRVANDFEAIFIPDSYDIQLNIRKDTRNKLILLSIALSFTVVVPISALITYLIIRSREPISANHTTLKAYGEYVTNINKKRWLQKEPTKDAILERMATKEPVKKISVEGQKDEWRIHKVVRVSEDDKVTVFSSRYNAQAQKFDQAIKEAEKEVEKGPRT